MLLDWVVYGAIIIGLALLISKKVLKGKPIKKSVLWSYTIALFVVNTVIMTVLKQFRYEAISESVGGTIQPNNPLDITGAAIMTFLFYSILKGNNKKPEIKDSNNTPE